MRSLKLILSLAGMVFAIAGIATDNRAVVWAAIGLLGVAFILRMVERGGRSGP